MSWSRALIAFFLLAALFSGARAQNHPSLNSPDQASSGVKDNTVQLGSVVGQTIGLSRLPVLIEYWQTTKGDGPPHKMNSVGVKEHAPIPFRGVRNCASCHAAQARTHPATSMAHAMETIAECDILRQHPELTAQLGQYSYRIERKGDQSVYTVTDGVETFTTPLGWAFGLGAAGQTYVFEKHGEMYESRVSFYRVPNALDMTMGAQKLHPTNILEAAGRYMGRREAALCFGCHTTNGASKTDVTLDTMTPGVQCERCHGPTENHLEGLRRGDPALFAMKKLSLMTTEETSDFCGQCHRTWQQIAMNGPHGTANVRFQPYRLTNSKCYDAEDKRISCLACHDPHQEVDHNDAGYDSKCLACHGGGKPEAKACKTAKTSCVSCHMIKVELPGGHHKFTDHDIRIASATGAYPD